MVAPDPHVYQADFVRIPPKRPGSPRIPPGSPTGSPASSTAEMKAFRGARPASSFACRTCSCFCLCCVISSFFCHLLSCSSSSFFISSCFLFLFHVFRLLSSSSLRAGSTGRPVGRSAGRPVGRSVCLSVGRCIFKHSSLHPDLV